MSASPLHNLSFSLLALTSRAAVLALIMAALVGPASAQQMNYQTLSDREKTFLRTVFAGDEAKSAEFVEVAGINPNSIGGFPLSAWFYTHGTTSISGNIYVDLRVQRIVFEKFKQNPNPRITGDPSLYALCNHAPDRQEAGLHTAADRMATAFDALLRYGMRDKKFINDIFRGCFYSNAAFMSEYTYDAVISRLVKAGADINLPDPSGRPIEISIKALNAGAVERLVRDGAQANYHLKDNCPAPGNFANLYSLLIERIRPGNTEQVLRIVSALTRGGASPYEKASFNRCKFASFFDAVVDTGNLTLAKSIKEITEAKKSSYSNEQPAAQPANATVPASKIGAWQIGTKADTRPFAVAEATPADLWLKELRIECVAGGRLEYVPVPAKAEPVRALWVDYTFDEIPVTNGRLTGAAAAQLSKLFLSTEAKSHQGGDGEWFVGLVVNDQNRMSASVVGNGFSQARNQLLDHCKN